ncbi:hypothetical protein AVEN_146796-1 [Araneus ventricosus]|uniref:Uncharacterized protein n=1 Tax=Araneus ventricosus TaxID=182803 RepID=A0A4Y2D9E5_ARAVE|nr:hypothetical protein AVEN_146796-1 [Araneus ventricosus]
MPTRFSLLYYDAKRKMRRIGVLVSSLLSAGSNAPPVARLHDFRKRKVPPGTKQNRRCPSLSLTHVLRDLVTNSLPDIKASLSATRRRCVVFPCCHKCLSPSAFPLVLQNYSCRDLPTSHTSRIITRPCLPAYVWEFLWWLASLYFLVIEENLPLDYLPARKPTVSLYQHQVDGVTKH